MEDPVTYTREAEILMGGRLSSEPETETIGLVSSFLMHKLLSNLKEKFMLHAGFILNINQCPTTFCCGTNAYAIRNVFNASS